MPALFFIGCRALRTAERLNTMWLGLALAAAGSAHSPRFEYIAFGKTGSSTMRDMLGKRARDRGWGSVAKPGDRQICHYSQEGDCAAAPEGYVVQTSGASARGYCSELSTDCSAFTVLREVTARIVSDWEYFCLECREGRKKCKNGRSNASFVRDDDGFPLDVPPLSCPDMSLVDYAVALGNPYTFALSEDRPTSMTAVNETTFISALRASVRDVHLGNLTVLYTEELSTTIPRDLLAGVFRENSQDAVPRRNVNRRASNRSISCDVQVQVQRALKWDLLLLHHLRLYTARAPSVPLNANCPTPSPEDLHVPPSVVEDFGDIASFV